MGENRPDAEAYGRGLTRGLGINLIYADLEAAARFQVAAFGAEIVYWEADFAIMRGFGSEWMLHSDRSYRSHPLRGVFAPAEVRGAGVELRLYGCDPDAAVAAAEAAGGIVLDPPADKPHGTREAFIADAEGYVWVPTRPKDQ